VSSSEPFSNAVRSRNFYWYFRNSQPVMLASGTSRDQNLYKKRITCVFLGFSQVFPMQTKFGQILLARWRRQGVSENHKKYLGAVNYHPERISTTNILPAEFPRHQKKEPEEPSPPPQTKRPPSGCMYHAHAHSLLVRCPSLRTCLACCVHNVFTTLCSHNTQTCMFVFSRARTPFSTVLMHACIHTHVCVSVFECVRVRVCVRPRGI
jgi:hypothetical protein